MRPTCLRRGICPSATVRERTSGSSAPQWLLTYRPSSGSGKSMVATCMSSVQLHQGRCSRRRTRSSRSIRRQRLRSGSPTVSRCSSLTGVGVSSARCTPAGAARWLASPAAPSTRSTILACRASISSLRSGRASGPVAIRSTHRCETHLPRLTETRPCGSRRMARGIGSSISGGRTPINSRTLACRATRSTSPVYARPRTCNIASRTGRKDQARAEWWQPLSWTQATAERWSPGDPSMTVTDLRSQTVRVNSPAQVLFASLIGTTIEFFDFYIYATAAVLVFLKLFFPPPDPASATLASLATFAIAFFSRPVGSALFGHFGDRAGCKVTRVAALLTMGLSTVVIGLLPTYETIGVAAPLLLAICRFGQGLGLGGEWGGAVLLAIENAPAGRRAWYGMFPQLGAPLGFVCSSGIFLILSNLLTDDQFFRFGWRIPFLSSAILVLVGLYVRLKIAETPVFQRAAVR